MKNIIYQVVAKKILTVKVPIRDKNDQVVGEETKKTERTTLLGQYSNRTVADFIKDNTILKEYGRITVNGPLATANIPGWCLDSKHDLIETTNRVNNHIDNSFEGLNWLKTYRKPIEEIIEYGD